MLNLSRYRRIAISLASFIALACLVLWVRLRGPTDRACELVNAINVRNFARAGDLLEPQDQPLPDKWANPKHWGDDGALHADAYLLPFGISEAIGGVRHVIATVHLDAESDHGTRIFPHTFAVTANSLTRLPKKPDSVLYPVVIRPSFSEPQWEIPPDLADVPALDLRIADDEKKRYFLIDDVLDDVTARCLIDRSEVYLLAWSSSGPPALSFAVEN